MTATGGGPYSYQWQLNGNDLADGLISTVAGGYLGNGVAGTNASLLNPVGVAADKSGNLWIADTGHQLIRKMAANGLITTVAGNGTNGYAGDGGAATNASLNNPSGVAADAFGNLFIADAGNGFIRKVDTNGVITTLVGGGNVSLNNPAGVAVDATGNLFIADAGNGLIRKMNPSGLITTVAGNGTNGYAGDGGPAINASLNNPSGVAVDTAGNCILRMAATTVFAGSARMGSSAPWRAVEPTTQGTVARPSVPALVIHGEWRWTRPGMCISGRCLERQHPPGGPPGPHHDGGGRRV